MNCSTLWPCTCVDWWPPWSLQCVILPMRPLYNSWVPWPSTSTMICNRYCSGSIWLPHATTLLHHRIHQFCYSNLWSRQVNHLKVATHRQLCMLLLLILTPCRAFAVYAAIALNWASDHWKLSPSTIQLSIIVHRSNTKTSHWSQVGDRMNQIKSR